MLRYLKGLSIFAGTIIGVGIFGLPYVAMKAGFLVVVFYFLFLTAIALAIHLMYSEISLATKEIHRLPGAVGIYMGSAWKKITFVVAGLGLVGAILAYLIVGGEFLNLFFSPILGGNALIYTLIFFVLGASLIFRDIKSIAVIELVLLFVFFALLAAFFFKASPSINPDYFKTFDLSFFALPYGVILFSLWGSNIIPEIKEVLGGSAKLLKSVMVSGILLSTLTYLVFIYIILGVSGSGTTKEAISGFAATLGNGVVRFGFLFGVITCFTSFLTLGLTLKKVLWHDFKVSQNVSWFLACFVPLLMFLAGARNFIDIIGLTGAVAVGLMGTIITLLYRKFLRVRYNREMNIVFRLLPILFVLGSVVEIFYFIFLK